MIIWSDILRICIYSDTLISPYILFLLPLLGGVALCLWKVCPAGPWLVQK